MRSRFPSALIALALCTSTACGAASDVANAGGASRLGLSERERHLLAAFPEDRFLRGICYQAADPAAAKAEARADVARQIDAAVSSELRIESSSHASQDLEVILSKVAETARFEHAELIDVPPESVACEGKACRAMAVLDRTRATAALRPLVLAASRELEAAASRAADAKNDLPAFAAAYRDADRLFRAAKPLRHQVAVIERGAGAAEGVGAPEEPDDARMAGLLEARVHLLASQRATVDAGAVQPSADGGTLATAVAGALTDLGVATSTGTGCAGTLRVRLTGGASCAYRFVAHQCTLQVEAILESCPAGRELARARLDDPSFAGAHSRDANAARAAMMANVTREGIANRLREGWSNVLP